MHWDQKLYSILNVHVSIVICRLIYAGLIKWLGICIATTTKMPNTVICATKTQYLINQTINIALTLFWVAIIEIESYTISS